MLCLTRQIGTSIVIGDDITVTVLEVKGRQVRIGIDAPREVPIAREELVGVVRPQEPVAIKVD